MEKKYLNEEMYQKGKENLKKAAILVFIIGICIGSLLIFMGISKLNSGSDIKLLKEQKAALSEELIPYEVNKNEEFLTNGFSEEYYRLDNKIMELKREIMDIEQEISREESGFNKTKTVPFFIFGGFVIVASLMIGGSILMFANQRNILAFTVQQKMPIAKEGLDELAPAVGGAFGKMVDAVSPSIKKMSEEMAPVYGDVAKEIAKGIKEGLDDNYSEK